MPLDLVPSATTSAIGVSPMSAQPVQPMRNAAPEQEQQMGAVVSKLGEQTTDIGERIQDQLNNAIVKEADNNLAQSTMDTLLPYLQLQGKDAVNGYDETKQAISENAQKISDNLNDPLRKQMFRQVAVRRLMQANAQLQEHQLTQTRQYDLTETEKRVQVNNSAAIAQGGTWQMQDSPFATSKAVAMRSVDEALQLRGIPLDSATAKDAQIAASTNIHLNVIGQMLTAQNPGMAQEYFDRYQGEIDPKRWDDIGRSLKSQSALSNGVQMAMAKSDDIADGSTDIEELRAQLYDESGGGTAGFKVETFQAASAQLDAMYSRHNLAGQEKRDKLSIPVWQSILNAEAKGGKMSPSQLGAMPEFQAMKLSKDPETVKAAAAISDHVWGEYHALQSEYRQEARANKAANAQVRAAQQEEQRGNLTELQLNPDRIAQMSDAEVAQTAAQLGKTYGPQFMVLRRQVASPEALAKIQVPAEMTKAAMAQLGIKANSTKGSEFVDSITSFLRSQQLGERHVLNQQQMREAIAYGVRSVAVKDHSAIPFKHYTDTPLYTVTDPNELAIPSQDIPLLQSELAKRNLPDTVTNRSRAFDLLQAQRKHDKGGR